jgi:hypothetical protein
MTALRMKSKTSARMLVTLSLMGVALGALSGCIPATPPQLPATQVGGESGVDENEGKVPVTLYEKAFAANNLNTQNMGWKFSYLNVVREGTLNFTNGRAEILIDKLPKGQAGDLKLEILEASLVRYEGILRNQVLNAGTNDLTINLVPVGGTAELMIQITVGQSNGTPQVPAPITSPVPSPGPSPGVSPIVTGPGALPSPNTTPNPAPNTTLGLTWSKDVKKIIDRSCVECHSTGGRSPNLAAWPFGTSEASAAIVDRVIAVSVGGTMPPAPRDRLSAAEIDTIRRWKAEGLKP